MTVLSSDALLEVRSLADRALVAGNGAPWEEAGRLIARFLLVPLGAGLAILAAVLFIVAAHWNRFAALVAAEHSTT